LGVPELLDAFPPVGRPPEPPLPFSELELASVFSGGKPAEGAALHAAQIDTAIA
jgi:hypothetical protein